MLEATGEQNLATWLTSVSFAGAAAASFGVAWLRGGNRIAWMSTGSVAALFSVDEIVMLHEGAEDALGGQAIVDYAEPVIALVALALGFYAARTVTQRERAFLLCALASLAGAIMLGAVNGDSLAGFVSNGLSALEEVLELLVAFFVLAAALPALVMAMRRRLTERTTPSGA